MKGDRVKTEEGDEVEFVTERKTRGPARVITLRTALSVAALCTTLFGGITVWALRALIRDEIHMHDVDPRAHAAATETFRAHLAREDGAAAERREMLDRITRIETKVDRVAESASRLEGRMKQR